MTTSRAVATPPAPTPAPWTCSPAPPSPPAPPSSSPPPNASSADNQSVKHTTGYDVRHQRALRTLGVFDIWKIGYQIRYIFLCLKILIHHKKKKLYLKKKNCYKLHLNSMSWRRGRHKVIVLINCGWLANDQRHSLWHMCLWDYRLQTTRYKEKIFKASIENIYITLNTVKIIPHRMK